MTRERGRRPLSQMEIEEYIAEDLDRLETATDDYAEVLQEQAAADNTYKLKYARMFQSAPGSNREQRSAYADEHCTEEHLAFVVAEAEAKAIYQKLWTIRASLDALRSLNANVREQV